MLEFLYTMILVLMIGGIIVIFAYLGETRK